jgi:DNA-binding LytR/AlgR family response regulator
VGLVCAKTVRSEICTASEDLAARLKTLLERWALNECVRLSVERTESFLPAGSRSPELLFLDMDSVELPEQGRSEREKGGLVVISRDAGRAIHSYRWHPSAFLKPDFDERRFSEVMSACEKHWQAGRICLESPYLRRAFRLPLGRIRYVEASAHYCMFHQGKQLVRFRFAAGELEELLPKPPFVRCHRSYFVHMGAVTGMTYTTLTLRDGAGLPLGRTYVRSVREALDDWKA